VARTSSRFRDLIASAAFALTVFTATLTAQSADQRQDLSPRARVSQNDQDQPAVPQVFDTVVVTASRESEPTREITSNVTVLDQETIRTSTAKTVTDLVVEQGFNSVSYNDQAGVQIRGFGQLSGPSENTNTVLILLNGRRSGNANLTLLGLKNVQRIEIIRGPSAVQYGSSAMGGVINIITKRGTEVPSASVELGGGSDALARQQFAFSGAARGFDIAIGASNYGRDDITASGNRRWYHTGIAHNTNVNVDAGYSFGGTHRAGISYNRGDIRSQLSSNGIRPFSANTPDAAFTDYRKQTDNTAFSYVGSTSSRVWDWTANYSFGSYDQKPFANDLDTRFFNAQGGYTRARFSASFGLDDYSYDSKPASWSMKDTGFYTTGKLRLAADRVIVSGGLRFDTYTNESTAMASAENDHVGGSAGLALLPASWVKLRANYAEGFKVPAPTQVAGDGALYYLPNRGLQPENSRTVEFGADIESQHVTAGVTWFRANWNNKIVALSTPGVCSGGFGCYQYQNLRASTLAGLEASISADLAKATGHSTSLQPYLTFTWLQTRRNRDASQFILLDGSPTDTLPNTPDWMVSYGVRYTHPRLRLSTRLNAAYYGDLLTQDFSVVDYVTVFTAPYFHRPTGTVVNLSLDKELVALAGSHNRLGVHLDVNNLFDGTNESYWNYPGQGRNFYVGLRYDY
jgi:vitamin B12 transporter